MKSILFVAITMMLQSSYLQANPIKTSAGNQSKAVAIESFKIAIPHSWGYSTSGPDGVVSMSIFPPGSAGSLKLRALADIPPMTKEILRNLTNVDTSIPLDWQSWGELGGYQHDYFENGKFYKQWWLTSQEEILFLVYSSESQNNAEIELINQIVASLTVTR
jgi:hypothetical protein